MKYNLKTMHGALNYCANQGWLNDTRVRLNDDDNSITIQNLQDPHLISVFNYLKYFGWSELKTQHFLHFAESKIHNKSSAQKQVRIGDLIKIDTLVYQVIGFNIMNKKYIVRFLRCNYIQELDLDACSFKIMLSTSIRDEIRSFDCHSLRRHRCRRDLDFSVEEARPLLKAALVPLPKTFLNDKFQVQKDSVMRSLQNLCDDDSSVQEEVKKQERYVCLNCHSNELRYNNYFNSVCFVCKHKNNYQDWRSSSEKKTTGAEYMCYVQLPDDSSMSSYSEYTNWSESEFSEDDMNTESSIEEDIRLYDSWSSSTTISSRYSFDSLSDSDSEDDSMSSDVLQTMGNNFSSLSDSLLPYDYIETVDSLKKLSFMNEVYYLSKEQDIQKIEGKTDLERVSCVVSELKVKAEEQCTDIERVQLEPPPIAPSTSYFIDLYLQREVKRLEAQTDAEILRDIIEGVDVKKEETVDDSARVELELSYLNADESLMTSENNTSSRCLLM